MTHYRNYSVHSVSLNVSQKINFLKFQFFFLLFSEISRGDSVKQLNKFVWP